MVYSMFCASYLVVSDLSCGLWGECRRKLVLAPITLLLFNRPCTASGLQGDGDQICFDSSQCSNGPGIEHPTERLLGYQEHEKCYLFSPPLG